MGIKALGFLTAKVMLAITSLIGIASIVQFWFRVPDNQYGSYDALVNDFDPNDAEFVDMVKDWTEGRYEWTRDIELNGITLRVYVLRTISGAELGIVESSASNFFFALFPGKCKIYRISSTLLFVNMRYDWCNKFTSTDRPHFSPGTSK